VGVIDDAPVEQALPRGLELGVLGGTFDPIHVGHLIVAQEVLTLLALDRVLLVPARISPLKLGGGTMFTAEQRWRMVALATADNPGLDVSRIDLDREGPSFSVDTLKTVIERYAPRSLHFVLGADALASLPEWRQPREIVRLANLVAVTRPGHAIDVDDLERFVPGARRAIHVIDTLAIGISSTDLRERIQVGRTIRYQVHRDVLRYIAEITPGKAFVDGCGSATRCG